MTCRRDFLKDAAGVCAGLWLAPAPPRAEVPYPVPPLDGATIDRTNQVILVRHQGSACAFALSCPHQNTALKWRGDEGRFQCPKHHSRYTSEGVFISGRATRNMDRLPIRMDGSRLLVDVDRVYESDKDPNGWALASVRLAPG